MSQAVSSAPLPAPLVSPRLSPTPLPLTERGFRDQFSAVIRTAEIESRAWYYDKAAQMAIDRLKESFKRTSGFSEELKRETDPTLNAFRGRLLEECFLIYSRAFKSKLPAVIGDDGIRQSTGKDVLTNFGIVCDHSDVLPAEIERRKTKIGKGGILCTGRFCVLKNDSFMLGILHRHLAYHRTGGLTPNTCLHPDSSIVDPTTRLRTACPPLWNERDGRIKLTGRELAQMRAGGLVQITPPHLIPVNGYIFKMLPETAAGKDPMTLSQLNECTREFRTEDFINRVFRAFLAGTTFEEHRLVDELKWSTEEAGIDRESELRSRDLSRAKELEERARALANKADEARRILSELATQRDAARAANEQKKALGLPRGPESDLVAALGKTYFDALAADKIASLEAKEARDEYLKLTSTMGPMHLKAPEVDRRGALLAHHAGTVMTGPPGLGGSLRIVAAYAMHGASAAHQARAGAGAGAGAAGTPKGIADPASATKRVQARATLTKAAASTQPSQTAVEGEDGDGWQTVTYGR